MNFDQAFDRLIAHEGGYVNHPSDPGGETNFGISKRAYPDVDIKGLTRDKAKAIYKRDYWERAQCEYMHQALAFQVFDAAVNHGIGNAIRFLQRAINVADDGQVGMITLRALTSMPVPGVLMRFNAERLAFYCKLSTFAAFGKGWAKRVSDNLIHAAKDA